MTKLGRKPADGIIAGQPFDTAVSANHRIPGLVWHCGELVASADVRWDLEKDGGGIDLVVSRSEDGVNWRYTYPGYLGDNGNRWNPDSSTLMDPVIISDGEKLYLLSDLFPAGYSISDASTTYAFRDPAAPFTETGDLLLSGDGRVSYDYCLKDGKVVSLTGEETGCYVRDWFDLYDRAGNYISNLFFNDSPYQPRATSFICMTVSCDGGASWSAPKLLDLKEAGTPWLILGPGSGLVTRRGELAFTAYDGAHIYLIWGRDGAWNKVSTAEATNESSIVELKDGTIRAFVKRGGSNTVAYVDFFRTENGYRPGTLVDTGDGNFSHCMVSSLRCAGTWKGREVVLVCCPSDSGGGLWSGRFNGRIYAYALDEENRMTLIGKHPLNKGFFAYSNMAQLPDGRVGVLYEDDCISYRAGSYEGKASHITYTTVALKEAFGIEFD